MFIQEIVTLSVVMILGTIGTFITLMLTRSVSSLNLIWLSVCVYLGIALGINEMNVVAKLVTDNSKDAPDFVTGLSLISSLSILLVSCCVGATVTLGQVFWNFSQLVFREVYVTYFRFIHNV